MVSHGVVGIVSEVVYALRVGNTESYKGEVPPYSAVIHTKK